MTTLSEYVAAALVHLARQRENGIIEPRGKLRDTVKEYWRIPVSEEDVAGALRVLNSCDISYVEEDEFAGTFVVITGPRFDQFIERVAKEQDEYNNIVKSSIDENFGLSVAEDANLPYLTAYQKHAVLRKYSAFGAEWLNSAIEEIRRRADAGELEVAAEDRVIVVDQADPKVAEIKAAAEELRSQLRTGNDLGTLTPQQASAAANEVEQLQNAFSAEVVRPSEIARKAKQTLRWISERAAGTLVGQGAMALFKLIMHFLGIPI